jgi:iron(III) transport system substrate-binding protein
MQERTRAWKALRLTALASVTALMAAACGGSGTTTAPSAAAPTTAPSAGASAPASAGAGDALADICAAGVQEGELVLWNNHSEMFVQVTDAFSAAYPGIEVETLTLSPDDSAQRVLTESAGGRPPSADVIAGGLDIFKGLVDRGLVRQDIDWAGLGVSPDVLHESNLVRIHRIALGLGYNTDNYTADDLPDTWEELIDPKWTGQVVTDPRGRPFDSLSLSWGEEQTLDYVRRMKDTIAPLLIEGGTAGLVAVAGGEAAITTGGRSAETLEQQAKGAPLDIKYMDVVTTIDNYDVVLAEAPHPNAAICFVTWFSTQGQDLYNEVEFKTNDSVPPDAPAGAEVIAIDTPEQSDAVRSIGDAITKILVGN